MIFLRIVHIGSGMVWVGGVFYVVFVELPQIRRFSASAVGESLAGLKAGDRVMGPASVLTIASGITIALRLKWGVLDTWFVSGWGYAILVAFAATLLYFVIALAQARRYMVRLDQLAAAVAGRVPSAQEEAEIREGYAAMSRHWIPLIFLVIAVGAMAAARWL